MGAFRRSPKAQKSSSRTLLRLASLGFLLAIVTGLSSGVLAQWIDVKTGQSVPDWPYIPGPGEGSYNVHGPGGGVIAHIVLPDASDPKRAYDPATGRNFARDKCGRWIDVKTGERVPSWPYISGPGEGSYNVHGPGGGVIAHIVLPDASDPKRAYDPATGRNFARKDCPPENAATSSPTPQTGMKIAPKHAASDDDWGGPPEHASVPYRPIDPYAGHQYPDPPYPGHSYPYPDNVHDKMPDDGPQNGMPPASPYPMPPGGSYPMPGVP